MKTISYKNHYIHFWCGFKFQNPFKYMPEECIGSHIELFPYIRIYVQRGHTFKKVEIGWLNMEFWASATYYKIIERHHSPLFGK